MRDRNKKYGTIYECSGDFEGSSGIPLYYLEEENKVDFSKLDTSWEVIPLMKKIKSFRYKKEDDSDPYLLFDIDGRQKKIFVESSDLSFWRAYSGFNDN